MSNLDYFNYGMGAQGLTTQQDYQPQQFNAQGQSLSPTPLSNGAPITVDNTNDQRTAQDFKRQALEAQKDTASLNDNDPNAYVGRNGYRYTNAVTDDSREAQARTAAQGFAEGYFSHMGDQTQAIAAGGLAASHAVSAHDKAIKRTKMISNLENLTNPDGSYKYNPMDIDKWVLTQDPKDLITNAGTWTSDGNGYLHNTLTGEIKQIPDYQSQKPQELHYLKNDDGTYTAVNPVTNQVVGGVGTSNAVPSGTSSGGGIGLDDEDSNETPAMKDGQYGNYDKKGNFKPLGTKDQEYWRNKGQAGTPDANQKLVSDDLNVATGATDEQINHFTGQLVGRSKEARDLISSQDPEIRKIYQSSERLTAQMGNSAISAAKAAGASGINTEAEIKRFTQGVPQVDYTSVENYKASIKKIQEYANDFRDSLIRGKGGKVSTQSAQSTSHLTDDELLAKYK